ncbi:hypothetical protein PR202_gb05145 [Eleusine coracana subsp. coracana]|uniref:Uncharacterized protein n=1 Tax=Eleusine coracana subsp. coracana TaxID=191504 RepID=A0AAV5E759_ELECO|nr:hypothetical protein PR202_gb05145 [Eleusine coracana subsp. coracana]
MELFALPLQPASLQIFRLNQRASSPSSTSTPPCPSNHTEKPGLIKKLSPSSPLPSPSFRPPSPQNLPLHPPQLVRPPPRPHSRPPPGLASPFLR